MNIITQAVEVAHKMKECYDTKVKHFAFDGTTDKYVKVVHQWMPNHKNNALLAAMECIKAWQEKHPGENDGHATMGFLAAAYYIVEVEPHRPKQASVHDTIMLTALKTVKFGHFNNSDAFVKDIAAGGVRTPRQRWWLTTLVVRHRKQIKNQAAVQTAERWLKDNPEPSSREGGNPDPGSSHPGEGRDLDQSSGAPDRSAPQSEAQPTLF